MLFGSMLVRLHLDGTVACDFEGGTYHSAECKDIEVTFIYLAPISAALVFASLIMPVAYCIARLKNAVGSERTKKKPS